MKRISFSVDDSKAEEITAYARHHGFAGPGDYARVCVLRDMRRYPMKGATSRDTAEPVQTQPEASGGTARASSAGVGPATDGVDPLPAQV